MPNDSNIWATLVVKRSTHEQIKRESEVTGTKMWALVDRMVENYFRTDY